MIALAIPAAPAVVTATAIPTSQRPLPRKATYACALARRQALAPDAYATVRASGSARCDHDADCVRRALSTTPATARHRPLVLPVAPNSETPNDPTPLGTDPEAHR